MSSRRSSRERKPPEPIYDTSVESIMSPPPARPPKSVTKSKVTPKATPQSTPKESSITKTPTSIMKKTGQGSSAKRSRSSKKSTSFASPDHEEDDEDNEDEEEDDESILKVPKKKIKNVKKKKETFTGGLSIFHAMKRGAALDSIAKNWVSGYKGDGGVVLVDLINLIFCCAGATSNLLDSSTRIAEYDEDDWKLVVDQVRDELASYVKGPTDTKYPIMGGSKESLKLRANISEFAAGIVRHCRSGQCYNYPILETIVQTLGYIGANLLCLRHTVTVTAYAFAESLVAAAADLTKKLEVAERQEAAELKRDKKSKKSRDLSNQVASLRDSINSLNEVISTCFSGTFMHRYRDVRAVLREESVSALGRWMTEYPEFLLDDQYLKYFGWLLNDKEAIVRIAVLESLHRIISLAVKNLENGMMAKLLSFLDRFNHRVSECCHDVNNDVSMAALTLMNLLLTSGVLGSDEIEVDDESIDQIDAILFDTSRTTEIRELAGKFMMERSEYFGKDDQKTPISSKKSTKAKDTLAMNQLDEILEFADKMIGSTQHPCSVDAMVDALASQIDLFVDWETMTSHLLADDGGSKTSNLNDEKISLLIHMFCGAVDKSCEPITTSSSNFGSKQQSLQNSNSSVLTSPKSPSKSPFNKKNMGNSLKTNIILSENSENLSAVLIKNLSKMLSKFQTEESTLEPLVKLVFRIQPQHISMGANKKSFTSLCHQLKDLLFISEGKELICLICDALRYLFTCEHSRQAEAQSVIQEIVTSLEGNILEILSPNKKKGKGKPKVDDYSLGLQLMRFACLAKQVDVTLFSESIDSDLLPLLEELVSDRTSDLAAFVSTHEDEQIEALTISNIITSSAVELLYASVLWGTKSVMGRVRDEELDFKTNPDAEENSMEEVKAAEAAEVDEDEEPSVDPETKEDIQLVLDRRARLIESLTEVMSYHLVTSKFDPTEGLPDLIDDLDDQVLKKVREVQLSSFGILGDLQCLHAMGLTVYDQLRQLAWEPSPQILLLSANFFNVMNPNTLAEEDEENEMDEDETKDEEDMHYIQAKVTKKLTRLSPLEAHIKALIYNPHHRSRGQASSVFNFLGDGAKRKTPYSASASAKYFFDSVKQKNGMAKLLEIQMTSLQLGFNNNIRSDTAYEDGDDFTQRILFAYDCFIQHSKSMAQLLGIPGKASRDEASQKFAGSMFSFLKEGIRYATCSENEPKRLGFLSAMQPFLPHLSSTSLKKKLQDYFKEMFTSLPKHVKSKVSFTIPNDHKDDEDEEDEDDEIEMDENETQNEKLNQSVLATSDFYDKLFPGHKNHNKNNILRTLKRTPEKSAKKKKRVNKRKYDSEDDEEESEEEEEEQEEEEEEEEEESYTENTESYSSKRGRSSEKSTPKSSAKKKTPNGSKKTSLASPLPLDESLDPSWLEKKTIFGSSSSSTSSLPDSVSGSSSKAKKRYGSNKTSDSSSLSAASVFGSSSLLSPKVSKSNKHSSTSSSKKNVKKKKTKKSKMNDSDDEDNDSENEEESEEEYDEGLSPKKKRRSAAEMPSQDW